MIKFSSDNLFLITGASSGIGEAISLKLNELGAKTVLVARNREKLLNVKNKSKYSENIYIETKDLTENIDSLPDFISELREKYSKFSGFVNSHGIVALSPLRVLNNNTVNELFNVNYNSSMMLAKGFLDRRNNIGEGASLLFIASYAGVKPSKGQIIYSATKAALIASCIAMSKEYSYKKIRINCISPAWVKTPAFEKQNQISNITEDNYPLGFGEPRDVANLTAFLMSDEAKWITGQNYILDGGGGG